MEDGEDTSPFVVGVLRAARIAAEQLERIGCHKGHIIIVIDGRTAQSYIERVPIGAVTIAN